MLDEQFKDCKEFKPGYIVVVSDLNLGLEDKSNYFLNRPVHVLLNRLIDGLSSIWSGWIVASEIDYASWWDALVVEEDGLVHPDSRIIQSWNKLYLFQGSINFECIVGEISDERLRAIRSLEKDYLLTVSVEDLIYSFFEENLKKEQDKQNAIDRSKLQKQLVDAMKLINFYNFNVEKNIDDQFDDYVKIALEEGIDASVKKIIHTLHGHDLLNKKFPYGTHVTSDGIETITGLPIAQVDERLEYQNIYSQVAGVLKEAVLEIENTAAHVKSESISSQWGKAFIDGIESIRDSLSILIQPEIAIAMSSGEDNEKEDEEKSHFVIENCVKISKKDRSTYRIDVKNDRFPEIIVRLITSEGLMEDRRLRHADKNHQSIEFTVDLNDNKTVLEIEFPEREPKRIPLV